MAEDRKVMAAEVQVEKARARLLATVEDITRALEPKKLVREMWEGAKVKGADLAEDAVDAVKARPVAAGGALAAVAMFLAREPLMDLAGKFLGKGPDAKAKAEDEKASVKDDTSTPTKAADPAPVVPAAAEAKPPPRRRPAPRTRAAQPPIKETTP